MSERKYDRDLDPTPLVTELLNRSTDGKVSWEPTANKVAFITSVAGRTWKVDHTTDWESTPWGGMEQTEVPRLTLLDEKGNPLWEIYQSKVKGRLLWDLYRLAQRIGNKLDDEMQQQMSALGKL
jgi:hypothetical protein